MLSLLTSVLNAMKKFNPAINPRKMKAMSNLNDERFRTELFKTTKRDLFMVDPRQIVIEEGANTRIDYNIEDIIDSIRENGVKVPLLCYKKGEQYFVIAGHRRITAVNQLLEEGVEIARVPVMKMDKPSEIDRLLLMVIENDGKPFTPYELAVTYTRLINFGFSATEIAKKVGKTLSHVSQTLDILDLPQDVQEHIKEGNVSASKAIKIKKAVKADKVSEVINKAVKDGKKTKKDKLKIKLDDIEQEVRSEQSKSKVKMNVTCCSDCGLCLNTTAFISNASKVKPMDICGITGDDVTKERKDDKRPTDCPLNTKIFTIKLI